MKLGIIGGSFNPIHNAHLIIAERFKEQLGLDKCIFVPASISPFKIDVKDYLEGETRLELVKLATDNNPEFIVCDYEIEKGGVSYTYDTIEHIKEEYAYSELYFLIGSDNAHSFKKWKNWEQILRNVQLVVTHRPGYLTEELIEEMKHGLSFSFHESIWIDCPLIDISSTEIRKRISLGMSIKYIVPHAVEQYIYEHKLFL